MQPGDTHEIAPCSAAVSYAAAAHDPTGKVRTDGVSCLWDFEFRSVQVLHELWPAAVRARAASSISTGCAGCAGGGARRERAPVATSSAVRRAGGPPVAVTAALSVGA